MTFDEHMRAVECDLQNAFDCVDVDKHAFEKGWLKAGLAHARMMILRQQTEIAKLQKELHEAREDIRTCSYFTGPISRHLL